jgi:hypothetical protein
VVFHRVRTPDYAQQKLIWRQAELGSPGLPRIRIGLKPFKVKAIRQHHPLTGGVPKTFMLFGAGCTVIKNPGGDSGEPCAGPNCPAGAKFFPPHVVDGVANVPDNWSSMSELPRDRRG